MQKICVDLQSFLSEVRQIPSSFATAFSGKWKYLESSSRPTSLLANPGMLDPNEFQPSWTIPVIPGSDQRGFELCEIKTNQDFQFYFPIQDTKYEIRDLTQQ